MNFNSKNGGKISFSYKTKASKSFILIRRMCLWYLIIKRKKIIMWIYVCPNWQITLILKMVEREFFLWIQRINSVIPIRRKNFWCPIIKRKEIILWIHVYPIEKRTLILKLVEKDVISLKPKLQYHLSQWGECVYVAYWLKENRLLCESVFLQIDEWTLILKMVKRDVFLMKWKHQYHLSQWPNEQYFLWNQSIN